MFNTHILPGGSRNNLEGNDIIQVSSLGSAVLPLGEGKRCKILLTLSCLLPYMRWRNREQREYIYFIIYIYIYILF